MSMSPVFENVPSMIGLIWVIFTGFDFIFDEVGREGLLDLKLGCRI